MHVLDASAFIDDYTTDEAVATVPAVREELTDDSSGYRFDALEGAGMQLHVPGEGPLAQVERAARSTGDFTELSDTDVRLLAAAFELGATLVTDDYAMQNVADELDVATESISQDGIDEQRSWDYQCQGCGRVYDSHRERCEVCGADLERKNSS